MFKIDGNNLYLTRGDTAYLSVNIGGNDRVIKNMTLSVKKNVVDTDYAFQLTAADNGIFMFQPEDTKDLEYGKYVYDIQITTEYNEIFTIVEKSNLYIKDEVTI